MERIEWLMTRVVALLGRIFVGACKVAKGVFMGHAMKAAVVIVLMAPVSYLVPLVAFAAPAQNVQLAGTYQEINSRVFADQTSFYVYLDQDSAFNHGFPSGWFGFRQLEPDRSWSEWRRLGNQ
jgi:hypothetical protein